MDATSLILLSLFLLIIIVGVVVAVVVYAKSTPDVPVQSLGNTSTTSSTGNTSVQTQNQSTGTAGSDGEGGGDDDSGIDGEGGGDDGAGGNGSIVGIDPSVKLCTSSGTKNISDTIIVESGETYDGKCQTIVPSGAMGDGSQAEDQKPYFKLYPGGTIKNVILSANGLDGIWFVSKSTSKSDTWTLNNVTWTDVGEDACSFREEARDGTLNLVNCSMSKAKDKSIQAGNSFVGTINLVNTHMFDNYQTFRVGVEPQTYRATNCELKGTNLIYGGAYQGPCNGVAKFEFTSCKLGGGIHKLCDPAKQVKYTNCEGP